MEIIFNYLTSHFSTVSNNPFCKKNEVSNKSNENKISNAHIKGSIKTREINLERYRNGNIQVIFLNASYNGSGLNLQETTDIILFHEMPTNNLSQILGRANRIGRKIPLNVHHLKIQG